MKATNRTRTVIFDYPRCFFRLSTIASILLIAIAEASAQESRTTNTDLLADPDEAVLRRLPSYFFTTEAYKREALRMLIEEANGVAKQLNLPERLPITISNLIEVFIQPPGSGAVGTISTTNYAYKVGSGRKFCGVDQRNMVESFNEAKAKYTWAINLMDTNKAFQVATQILAAVNIDVTTLNHDCVLDIHAPRPEESNGRHFIPDYWVTWRKSGKLVAFIEFVEPAKSIRQLHVADPKYVLREPIKVPHLAELLNQTNGPVKLSPAQP